MVRQLQPTSSGIPLEIYCFAKEINWVPYEGIVSDIFDHLIASATAFGLNIYQAPTSRTGYPFTPKIEASGNFRDRSRNNNYGVWSSYSGK
jgi:hypothetical protein